jgi:MFS transporter, MHS family, proline/betaine transporter
MNTSRDAPVRPSVPDDEPVSPGAWRIVILASLGGTLEFYDFVIFGIFAKDIADAIFPSATPIISLMASFAAFATGYLARPVGGIVLSHFGDRYGRRRVFLVSLFVMSGATLGMGLVPSYAAWGAAASALLVVLRVVQGFCLGGELPGALTYVVETAPRQAPLMCGVVFSCVTMGVAVATGISLAVRTWLPHELVPMWGWRLAFAIGGLGGFLSFALRRSLEESPEFVRMKELASRQPFREVLKGHLPQVAIAVATIAATGSFTGLFFAHMAAYLSGVLHYDPRQVVVSQTAGVVVHALGILGVGRLANRVPPRVLSRVGSVALAALAFPFYAGLVGRSNNLTLLMVLAGACAALVNGSFAVLLTDMFPTRVRFSGVALAFNIGFTVFSGMTPLAATTLIQSTGLETAPALLIVAGGLVTLAGSFGLSRGGHVLARSRSR